MRLGRGQITRDGGAAVVNDHFTANSAVIAHVNLASSSIIAVVLGDRIWIDEYFGGDVVDDDAMRAAIYILLRINGGDYDLIDSRACGAFRRAEIRVRAPASGCFY